MPKISVIVPFYNAESTLQRCIDSILTQDYEDFELLLVDDGSTDKGRQIADTQALIDKRIKVFHKHNGGISSARNLGINSASGEYITFCDADDWVYRWWLEDFIKAISPEVDLVVQGYVLEFRQNGLIREEKCESEFCGDVAQGLSMVYNAMMGGAVFVKLFRRQIIKANGIQFDTRFSYREDEEFVLRYATKCKGIHIVSHCGYHYYPPLSWAKKYPITNNQFELASSMYRSVILLCGKNYSMPMYYRIGDVVIDCLLNAFRKKTSGRYKMLRYFRGLMGDRVLSMRFFPLTRWSMYLDPTGIVSGFIFSWHAKFKRV